MAKSHLKLVTPTTRRDRSHHHDSRGCVLRLDLRTREYLTEAEVDRLMVRDGKRQAQTALESPARHGLTSGQRETTTPHG
jgi:hypothetical protein